MGESGAPEGSSPGEKGDEVPGGASFLGDMPPEEFRAHAHALADWAADYLREVGRYPVLPSTRPGDIRGRLPDSPPPGGEPFEDLFRDFQDVVLPGLTHWNHPAFFAYFANSASGPGILGEFLAAVVNANAMVWRTSPAGTELELHVVGWIRDLLGLPPTFEGAIHDTASTSSMLALAAARGEAWPASLEEGLAGESRGRVYASTEAHSSIDKAVITLGLGRRGVRRVEVDGRRRLRPEALRKAIREDLAEGVRPVAVVATLGTTSTSSVDPVGEVVEVAREYGLWLHVDAAYAGPAAMVPEFRHHFAGWEEADSIVLNPHKWLFTPMDCSLLYCRRPGALEATFSLTHEYLRTAEGAQVRNLMDTGLALGRRFRALKLWFILRWFGVDGLRARIREHVRLARVLAARVEAEPGWEMMAPVPFALAVFRYAPPGMDPEAQDALNLRILEAVNAGGEAFLSHTRLDGRVALRLSVGNLRTREVHVLRAWELLREAARTSRR